MLNEMKSRYSSGKKTIFSTLLLILAVANGSADERKFSYVYQSGILGKGNREIEVWTTPRIGKLGEYFARIDNRIEFETGLSRKLQTAFYLNFRNTTRDNGTGTNTTEFEFKGISSEWKYQVSSPTRNAVGFALYAELGLNTDEVELETKLIFDKKIKKTTLALNLTFEPEWELTPGKSSVEYNAEASFGLSHSFSSSFSAGFEVRNHNILTGEEGLENSALFAGPVISISQPNWWMTLTALPQIVALKGKSGDSKLELHDHERFEARMIFSFRL